MTSQRLTYFAWFVSIAATLGSLFFSQVWHLPPCVLCWYQRIMLYPLVLIIAVGILRKDKGLPFYVLPLAVIGWCISLFHNMLYYQILPESAAPCSAGISCTTKFFEWFGFVTIPFLSLSAFTLIIVSMVMIAKKNKIA